MIRYIKITVSCFLLLLLGVEVATAQSVMGNGQLITVTGKVVSVTDDQPLSGATVTVRGTHQGVATDYEGNFTIKAPEGSTLVVSYAGFEQAEVAVSDTIKTVRLIPAKPVSGWIYLSFNPKRMDEVRLSAINVYGPQLVARRNKN